MRHLAVMSVLCILVFGVTLQAKQKVNSNTPVGTWNCVAYGGPNGDVPFTLYIQKSTQGLTGSVSAPQGDTDLTSVTFKDDHLKIEIDTEENNYSLAATLVGGKLEGTWYLNSKKQGTWKGSK